MQIIVTKKGTMRKVAVDVRKNGETENKKRVDILYLYEMCKQTQAKPSKLQDKGKEES